MRKRLLRVCERTDPKNAFLIFLKLEFPHVKNSYERLVYLHWQLGTKHHCRVFAQPIGWWKVSCIQRRKPPGRLCQPDAPQMDFVLTVCDKAAGEVCPVWPGQPMTAHWGVGDPAAAVGSPAQIEKAFTDVFMVLQRRIALFLNLPIEKLEKLSLLKELQNIGQVKA
jgi:hypothetical protein